MSVSTIPALRCRRPYANTTLRLYVNPGEVLTDLDRELGALLVRESRGAFLHPQLPARTVFRDPPAGEWERRHVEHAARDDAR